MLSRLLRRKAGGESVQADEVSRLAKLLDKVDSTAAVKRLLWTDGLAMAGGLNGEGVALLQGVCSSMRERGLGLEPNLIARAACSLVLDRMAAGLASSQFAASDSDFIDLAANADRDRNSKKFGDAQYKYWRALQLYPFHPGFLIQYAHCLKEQGLFPDAIVQYVDAYRSGASLNDVEQHLVFAAEREGLHIDIHRTLVEEFEKASGHPLFLRLMSDDVQVLFQLLRGRTASILEVASCMSRHATRRSLVAELINSQDFSRMHKDLLGLLVETHRGLAK